MAATNRNFTQKSAAVRWVHIQRQPGARSCSSTPHSPASNFVYNIPDPL